MTAEEGARALYDAGRLFQLEELAQTLDMQPWLQLLAAHRRYAAAQRSMSAIRDERLQMERTDAELHPAEQEERSAEIHLLCKLFRAGVMTPGPGFRGILQMEVYQAAQLHYKLQRLCPEYLA